MVQKSVHIEKLDFGCIITFEGKSRAIQSTQDMKDWLTSIFIDSIKRIDVLGVRDMLINIEVNENLPKAV